MKPRIVLPVLSALLAAVVFAGGNKAEAVEVGVGVGVGIGGHHHFRDGVVEYRTVDPVYSTWYPDDVVTYDYPVVETPYVYGTDWGDFGVWYGGGRGGHGGHYGYRGGRGGGGRRR